MVPSCIIPKFHSTVKQSKMQRALLFALLFITSTWLSAQHFCFFDPNTGPIYHNGSSGAIYDATSRDFNRDGHTDLITVNSVAGNLSFVPGYGNGTLGSPDTISVTGTLFAITSADFNGDSLWDVATVGNGTLYVLLGNGNGTFQPYSTFSGGSLPSRMYAWEVSGDSIMDLVVACWNGLYVYEGLGNGSFGAPNTYFPGVTVHDVAHADMDNDGIEDVVATAHVAVDSSEIAFLKGVGGGTFTVMPPVWTISYPQNSIAGIAAGDLNGDTNVDLVLANSRNSLSRAEVYFGNGNGTFNAPQFYDTQYSPFYLYLADFNNDNHPDIAVEESNGFSVLKGQPGGTFANFEYFQAISSPNTLVIEDWNEDGLLDAAIPSSYFGSGLIALNLNCLATDVEMGEDAGISLYPNPTREGSLLELNGFAGLVEVEILNLEGKVLRRGRHLADNAVSLERADLDAGVYVVRVLDKEGEVFVRKWVVF